ncbi:hypothetical protein GCM10010873_35020 [Cypionkella aquatica]|uniref:Uncharacterized protein n=1 Tax=Cypionkella aquatica TaxID=1756042 RepID=A0AA37TVV7_9RHOB|nr:hypothetical protein [Cypionkella aquatica]GLS88528.1 hypothetical protein GCM10010873_35020 [Cypionkella aquatica]
MDHSTQQAASVPEAVPNPAADVPQQSGKTILLNWIIMILGIAGLCALGTLLPKLL